MHIWNILAGIKYTQTYTSLTEQERNLTALVRARGRLSLYVCTRVKKKGDFFWWSLECWEMASCILKQGKQRGSAVGEESRQTSDSSGGERASNRTRTWQSVHTNRQKHTRVQTQRSDKRCEQKPAESPGRNGFHFAFPIDGPPGSFRCLCVCGDG